MNFCSCIYRDHVKKETDANSFVRSPWLLAAPIYSLGIDGLHALLNIPSHIAKWFFIFAFDVYQGRQEPEHANAEIMITKHISHCIKLKCSFPKRGDKAAGRIKLFGKNIKRLTNTWDALMLLIECPNCSYDPWQFKLRNAFTKNFDLERQFSGLS